MRRYCFLFQPCPREGNVRLREFIPDGRVWCSTAAQACLSMEASRSASATGMMGSLAPERMSTGFPVKSACGSWESGTIARSRIAPPAHLAATAPPRQCSRRSNSQRGRYLVRMVGREGASTNAGRSPGSKFGAAPVRSGKEAPRAILTYVRWVKGEGIKTAANLCPRRPSHRRQAPQRRAKDCTSPTPVMRSTAWHASRTFVVFESNGHVQFECHSCHTAFRI
jgi:hypothetical protein